MTHLKMLGTWVRLPDGRSGHVAGMTLDGLSVIIDGRIVMVSMKDVTPIAPPPPAEHPEPVRAPQAPIKTCVTRSHNSRAVPTRAGSS
jgi:hypothetical protein